MTGDMDRQRAGGGEGSSSSALSIFESLRRQGVAILREIHAGNIGAKALVARCGWTPKFAVAAVQCSKRMCGSDVAGDVSAAVGRAELSGFSLEMLLLVDKRVRQINNVEIRDEYYGRFIDEIADDEYQEADRKLRLLVAQLNEETAAPQHVRARVSQQADVRGLKHMMISAPAAMIDRLLVPLSVRAAQVKKAHDDYTFDRCLGQACVEAWYSGIDNRKTGKTGYPNVDKLAYQPAIVMTVQDLEEYAPRYATTSDGSVLTPKEFAGAMLADRGWVVVYDENCQVDTMFPIARTRLATDHQRVAMVIDNPVCSWDGCDRPSIVGQAHHLKAHRRGGETSIENMTLMCREHHGKVDDRRRKEYVDRVEPGGEVGLINPAGNRVSFNSSAATGLAGRAYALYRARRIRT